MRLIAAILSIYILVLTSIPCCAFEGCEDERAPIEQTSGNKDKQHHEDKKEGCGTCSPFFCHSCSGFIIPAPAYQPIIAIAWVKKEYNLYSGSFYPHYIPFSWEPPDLSSAS